MKAKNNIVKGVILMLVTCGLLVSCSDFLDNEVHNITYNDVFWKNEADANAATSGAYALFRTAMLKEDPFFIWGDLPAGFFSAIGGNGWMVADAIKGGFHYMPYVESAVWDWTNWYRVVQQCNLIIDKIPGIPDKEFKGGDPVVLRNQYLGEGYFMRALTYFWMSRVWGDLPLEITPIYESSDIVLKGRTDVAEINKLIISDAKSASALMDWGADPGAMKRATKGSALALLAHVYAWTGDYANSLLCSDSIINSGTYRLEAGETLRNVFNPNTTTYENIFYISKSNSDKEQSWVDPGGYLGSMASKTLMDPYIKNRTSYPVFRPTKDVLGLYFTDQKDSRFSQFFGLTNTDHPIMIKYSDVGYKGSNYTGAYFESNMIIFRLADIILLKAEALQALSRTSESRDALNLIRKRAGIADVDATYTGELLKKEILNERIRELAGEGHNYWDQLRMKIYPGWYNGARTNPEYKSYLWPIHDDILKNNYLINQNEWWKSH